MKILTWNINGIRASKVLLKDLFNSLDADIICLQETKVTRDQLDGSVAAVDGYNSYFSFSRKRSGYSGVATFCKDSVTPWKAEEGLSGHAVSPNKDGGLGSYGNLSHFTDDELDSLDAEGRSVITQHKIRGPDGKEKELAIINVYCPRADAEREDRKLYKLRFYALLQTRAEALLQSGSHVIVLGDINSCHKQIDRCDPEEDTERVRPGRLWMNQLVWESGRDPSLTANDDEQLCLPGTTPSTKGGQFIDTFRHFHPHQKDAFTCWCTLTGARQTNYGRRLDYVFADVNLTDQFITDTVIMPEVEGSDHCPVRCDLSCEVVPCDKCPALCTKYMPEFSGKQQKLSDLFLKASAKSLVKKNSNPNDHHLDQNAIPISGGDFSGKPKTPSQKRPFTKENSLSGTNKRQKTQKSQQSNLMNFFGKPKTSVVETKVIHKPAIGQVNHGCSDIKGKLSSAVECFGNPEILPEVNLDTDVFGSNNQSKSVSNSGSADSDTDSGVTSSQEAVCNSHSSGDSGTVQITNQSTSEKTKSSAALAWKTLLSGPGKAPLCKGHKEPCVLRTVKKDGPNRGKQFYVCARGEGHSSNPEARCDFFKWVERKKPS